MNIVGFPPRKCGLIMRLLPTELKASQIESLEIRAEAVP
jgi:hypothetical protein